MCMYVHYVLVICVMYYQCTVPEPSILAVLWLLLVFP